MDRRIRAIAADAAIQITVVQTTGMVERARNIHKTLPLATAALGRTLTITSIMGSQLKVDDGSVTVQVRGDGPLGTIVCVADSQGYARGYLQTRRSTCRCGRTASSMSGRASAGANWSWSRTSASRSR